VKLVLALLAVCCAAHAAEPNWPEIEQRALALLQTYVRMQTISPPSNSG
jgi:hypothetical protein